MRPLEIIIPIFLAIYLLRQPARLVWIRLLPVFTLILILLHLFIEGYRWQMIPLYVLTGLLCVLSMARVELKRIGSVLTLILLAVSTALPILLPVPSIPASD